MKIGILTYHWVPNFGANLQTLSTYKFIENTGNTPIIINWIPQDLESYYLKVVPSEQIGAHIKYCNDNYQNITAICRNSKDIAKVIEEEHIEHILIGSDAVFTFIPFFKWFHPSRKRGIKLTIPYLDSRVPNPFWADFLDYLQSNIKVSAISASAQNTPFHSVLIKKYYSRYLKRFSYISVRDVWTKRMVEFLSNGDISPLITPDPVFAFEMNVRPQLKSKIKEPYALLSLTGKNYEENWVRELEAEFQNIGIKLIGLPQTNKIFKSCLKTNLSFPIDPIEWYVLIKYSRCYIGELMHPVLVSLHNNVPVYVFDDYGFVYKGNFDTDSSKTYQIMQEFDLLDNYYNPKLHALKPAPKEVVDCINNFDRDACARNSAIMREKYEKNMKNILSL